MSERGTGRRWLVAALFGALPLALLPVHVIGSARAAEDGPGPNLVLELGGGVSGEVVIDLDPAVAPNHVERIVTLARSGAYDGVVFHRVLAGFMAQTGDVTYGKQGGDLSRAGTGGSDLPPLKAEHSDRPFRRGAVGMARTADPDSANSQFFIMFDEAPHLDGLYTWVGQVIRGMEHVDEIRRGSGAVNGLVHDPDWIVRARIEP